MQDDLLAGVDFGLVFGGRSPIPPSLAAPIPALLVGDAVFERHPRLGHREVDIAAIIDLLIRRHRDVEQAVGILVDRRLGIRLSGRV